MPNPKSQNKKTSEQLSEHELRDLLGDDAMNIIDLIEETGFMQERQLFEVEDENIFEEADWKEEELVRPLDFNTKDQAFHDNQYEVWEGFEEDEWDEMLIVDDSDREF